MTSLRAAVVLMILALTTAAALPPATDPPPPAKTVGSLAAPAEALVPSSWSAHLDEAELGVWSRFHLHLDWTVPEVQVGDMVAFTLPAALHPLDSSFDVTGRDGTTIARATVAPGRDDAGTRAAVVTVTSVVPFDGRAETSFSAEVAVTWNRDVVTADSEVELQVTTAGQTRRVHATIAADDTDTSSARLYGYWQEPGSESGAGPLQWRFVSPVGPISTTELTLAAAPEHRLDCATLRLRALSAFTAGGDATEAEERPIDGLRIRCDARQVTLTLPPVPAGTALMVLISGSPSVAAELQFELTGQAGLDGRDLSLTSTIDRVRSTGSSTSTGAEAPAVTTRALAGAAAPATFWTTGVLASWWLALLLAGIGLTCWWLLSRAHRRRHRGSTA